jgi:hypothetical protein
MQKYNKLKKKPHNMTSIHKLRILFPQWSSGDDVHSSPERALPPTTLPVTHWTPCYLNFSISVILHPPISMIPSVSIRYPDTMAECLQAPWARIVPCFQVPRVSQA